MGKSALRGFGVGLAVIIATACGDDDPTAPEVPSSDASIDALNPDGSSDQAAPGLDGQPSADTSASDADATVDADAETDADPSPDAGADASLDATPDAAADATPDAAADATPDAGPTPRLYATHDGMLVRFNLATGAQSIVGSISPEPYRLAFNGATLFGLVIEAGPTYRLVTVDPCTGAVTPGQPLTIPPGAMTQPEGFAYSATADALFVSLSQDGVDNLSETLARVNIATGALTVIGAGTTDLDLMTSYQGGLLATDAALSGTWSSIYYSVSVQNGTSVSAGPSSMDAQLTGIAVHPTTSTIYGWQLAGANPFNLVTVNLGTGALTPIGVTHSGAGVGGFAFATVSCP